MKIYIGPYRDWIGPYQLASLLKYIGVSEDICDKIGEKLSKTFLSDLCEWIYNKKNRKVKIKIHDYDIWNLDNTLAQIILPLLKEFFKEMKTNPFIDDEDVPEELSSKNAPETTNYEWDDNNTKRWEFVTGELLWTFEQLHPDNDWEEQYHKGDIDIKWEPYNFNEDGTVKLYEMKKGPSDTHEFDIDGYMKHQNRIKNGLRLFGKYYQTLWS